MRCSKLARSSDQCDHPCSGGTRRRPARPRRRRRGPGAGATQSPTRSTRHAGVAQVVVQPLGGRGGDRRARPSRASRSWFAPVGWWSSVSVVPSKPIGTRSVDCTMPLAFGPHPPVLHVERDAEVLADDHARRDDLDLAAAVGEQLGDRRGVVEADLVDDDDAARRARRRRSSTSRTSHDVGRRRAAPTTGRCGSAPVATMTWSGRVSHDRARPSPRRRTRSSTPSRRHSVTWLRIMSPSSARFGTVAASRTCPPGWPALVDRDACPARAARSPPAARPARRRPPARRCRLSPAVRRPAGRDGPRGRCAGSRCSRASG